VIGRPPHPEEPPKAASRRIGGPIVASWFETRASQPSMRRLRKLACAAALLTMRTQAIDLG
jgi:hypothetical protein